MRRIIDGLRPATIDEPGLSGALLSQARAVSTPGSSLAVEVIIDPSLPGLADAVEVALLRISAETLTNAVRHATPTRCTVRLDWYQDRAVLRVQDDGPEMTASPPGHGIVTTRERAEELGGTLIVESAQPRGTLETAIIPATVA